MDRTIVVQLKPSPKQKALLDRTMQEHTACFNAVAQLGFTTGQHHGVQLHKETSYPLRAQVSRSSGVLLLTVLGINWVPAVSTIERSRETWLLARSSGVR